MYVKPFYTDINLSVRKSQNQVILNQCVHWFDICRISITAEDTILHLITGNPENNFEEIIHSKRRKHLLCWHFFLWILSFLVRPVSHLLGIYSPGDKMSDRGISWILEVARYGFKDARSFQYSTGASTADVTHAAVKFQNDLTAVNSLFAASRFLEICRNIHLTV